MMFARLLLVLLIAVPIVAAEKPYKVVPLYLGSSIAVPKDWRDGFVDPNVGSTFDRELTYPVRKGMTIFLYREGDGIGVPAADETGAPLQIGMSVYQYFVPQESPKEVANIFLAMEKQEKLKFVRKSVVPIKLSDGSDALLLTAESIKGGNRRSLHIIVIAGNEEDDIWIMSGHIIGGKASKWPTAGSSLAKWLTAHLTSFTLDEKKFDAKKLEAAYAVR